MMCANPSGNLQPTLTDAIITCENLITVESGTGVMIDQEAIILMPALKQQQCTALSFTGKLSRGSLAGCMCICQS